MNVKDKNGVHVNINQEGGYQGFTSHSGKEMFKAPVEWLANNIQFHTKSEHTVNEKQFDFEVQIFHKMQYPSLQVNSED